MKLNSLRLRLTLYAAIIVISAIVLTGIGLSLQFQRHIERRVGQELDAHLTQIIGDLRFDDAGAATLARPLSDPRFNRIFGGLYYQALAASGDTVIKSRSLWDTQLGLADDVLAPGDLHVHKHPGPDGSTLLIHERLVTFQDIRPHTQLRISVGIEMSEILSLREGFSNDLFVPLGLLALVLLGGFALQISAGLRPMDALRQNVSEIRGGKARRLSGPVPTEVKPLVDEMNGLLDLQEQNIIRARDRAADMAHGLKTPLSALRGDVNRLRDKGEVKIADDIQELGLRMQRHLDRELARARHRHSDGAARTDAQAAVAAIIRTLARTPNAERITFHNNLPDQTMLNVDPDDFNEIMGNLLENACRYGQTEVRVDYDEIGGRSQLRICDDGPGLSDDQIAQVSLRGVRLDSSGQGAGLGLSIVRDIVEAYGGQLLFEPNEPTGLIIRVRL